MDAMKIVKVVLFSTVALMAIWTVGSVVHVTLWYPERTIPKELWTLAGLIVGLMTGLLTGLAKETTAAPSKPGAAP